MATPPLAESPPRPLLERSRTCTSTSPPAPPHLCSRPLPPPSKAAVLSRATSPGVPLRIGRRHPPATRYTASRHRTRSCHYAVPLLRRPSSTRTDARWASRPATPTSAAARPPPPSALHAHSTVWPPSPPRMPPAPRTGYLAPSAPDAAGTAPYLRAAPAPPSRRATPAPSWHLQHAGMRARAWTGATDARATDPSRSSPLVCPPHTYAPPHESDVTTDATPPPVHPVRLPPRAAARRPPLSPAHPADAALNPPSCRWDASKRASPRQRAHPRKSRDFRDPDFRNPGPGVPSQRPRTR